VSSATTSVAAPPSTVQHLIGGSERPSVVRDLRAPFGGVGNSGLGREGGNFSRDFYTEPQAVFLDTTMR
jgi:acyl-CoA reductase-like NAD-dependent aldehyde dehydrogenase